MVTIFQAVYHTVPQKYCSGHGDKASVIQNTHDEFRKPVNFVQ